MALVAIWAVHGLTKSRDREKAVFDLYKTVGEATAALKPIIVKAWVDPDQEVRKAAVAETIWRLQQIGGFVERIRRQSTRWAWAGIRTPRMLPGIPYLTPRESASCCRTRTALARTSQMACWFSSWVRHVLWFPGWTIEIRLTGVMAELRDAITEDPFNDPGRGSDSSKNEFVELAIGGFLQSLDEQLFIWMDDGKSH